MPKSEYNAIYNPAHNLGSPCGDLAKSAGLQTWNRQVWTLVKLLHLLLC